MFSHLTRAALVFAALAAGSATLGTAPAAAGTRLVVTTVEAPIVQFVDHRRGHDRFDRRSRRAETCNPEQALRKADRLGINRARLVRADRRSVLVQGRARGDRVLVRFAQARGCPVIGYR